MNDKISVKTNSVYVIDYNKFTKLEKDLSTILSEISENKEYKEKEVHLTISNFDKSVEILKKKEEEFQSLSKDKIYYGEILKSGARYLGCFNEKLERHFFGVNFYSNNDIYVGHLLNNKKHGIGFYSVHGENEINSIDFMNLMNLKDDQKPIINIETYNGYWKNNKKHGLGTYLQLKDKLGNMQLDQCKEINCFIGTFYNDKMYRGIYLERHEKCYTIYYGNFNEDGKKHDSKALIYDNQNQYLIRAKFENDQIIHGYLDTETELMYLVFEKGQITHISKEKYIDKDTIVKVKNECSTFRNILEQNDCFSKCYTNIKVIMMALQAQLKGLNFDKFNSDKSYENLMKVISKNSEQEAFKILYKNVG